MGQPDGLRDHLELDVAEKNINYIYSGFDGRGIRNRRALTNAISDEVSPPRAECVRIILEMEPTLMAHEQMVIRTLHLLWSHVFLVYLQMMIL